MSSNEELRNAKVIEVMLVHVYIIDRSAWIDPELLNPHLTTGYQSLS